ncbi:MAG: rRNA maturation RNase YbeY [Lachnospiraceae bacterium]|nr:rRNA maturation RNase YbeY [Lachnospiraceae bacterium]
MTYGYDNEVDARFDFDEIALYRKVVDTVLEEENCPYEAEVELLIVDDSQMKMINREQRNIDNTTDVLSFPMVQYEVPGDFSKVEEMEDCFNIDTGELLLGDIVLSIDRIRSQAEEFGHSERREYAFLIVHSMLHLIGYDHIDEKDRLFMEDKQRKIMELLGILR